MKYLVYILLSALTPVIGWGQSLIMNNSFEQITECPNAFGQLEKLAFWTNVGGSVDIFSTCSVNIVPDLPNGPFEYADFEFGDSYIHLFVSFPFRLKSDTIFREYLQGELKQVLTNSTHYFSAHIYTNQPNRTNHLALYFTPDDIGFIGSYPKDIETQYEFDEWIGGYNTWKKHEACIEGIAGANYLTIGNFHEPGNDLVEFPDIEFSNGIFIDNLILKEIPNFADTTIVLFKNDCIEFESSWNGIPVEYYNSESEKISTTWCPQESTNLLQRISNCTTTRNIEIQVIDCDCEIYLPNIISSSSYNPVNSQFVVGYNDNCINNNFQVDIYSRWGNRIFSGQPNNFDPSKLPQGVYVFAINYTCRGQSITKTNDVTIIN